MTLTKKNWQNPYFSTFSFHSYLNSLFIVGLIVIDMLAIIRIKLMLY